MPAQGALEFSRYIIRGGGIGGGPEHRFILLGGRVPVIVREALKRTQME